MLDTARELLDSQPDFKEAKSALQEMIEESGHRCIFLPKFHCEFNSIGMVWGRMKKELRRIFEYSFPALVKTHLCASKPQQYMAVWFEDFAAGRVSL